jgi:hypothetical protein
MPDLKKGDELIFTFRTGEAVDVEINGRSLGNIPGEDFARGLLAAWLGPAPPTSDLKEGMLGRTS